MPKHRIWTPRPAGIPTDSDAPFWRGETAERIVRRRAKLRTKEKAAKLAKRKRK